MAIIRVRDENGKILEIPAFAGPVGGHYKPVVEQTASDTVKMSFAASRDDMESIDPVEIKLPAPESSQNADWSQNDPTQPDYVKNRTHWEENNQTVIEWDGDTEGRDSFNIYGGETDVFYKVSDDTPGYNDLIGAVLTIYGYALEITEENASDIFVEGNGVLGIGEMVAIFTDTTFQVPDIGTFTAPSTGLYFNGTLAPDGMSLTYGSTTVHQLDEKFVPESIARTVDIPTDEHINSLINTALGVIENGAY